MIPPIKPDNERERLAALYQLNILDTEREERFDRVTRIATKLFNVPISVISFLAEHRQWMKSTEGMEIIESPRENSFCGHVILSDEMMIIEDASKDIRFHDNPFVINSPYFRFYLGCPLKVKKQNVGVICLIDDKPRSKQHIDHGTVLDLAQMVELELESLHQATTDELTGLSNRRGFLKIADYLFEHCRRENKPFSLLFFDLDKFKHINDTFGHAEGDKVLCLFSKIFREQFRSYDVMARLGGDEFCVFCAGATLQDIDNVIKHIKTSIQKIKPDEYDIEFSVGALQYNKDEHHSLAEMLSLADSKMYRQKKQR